MEIGQQVTIQSFKHNGSLHRTWSKGVLIEKTESCWVVVTYKTFVVESNNRMWQTREPAICFFYPHEWFNVIAMIRRNGITFYCNIASPCLFDGEAIKNIDYDLDVKVYPDGYIEVLDQDEYDRHKEIMNYSPHLQQIIEKQVETVVDMIKEGHAPFDEELVRDYYFKFLGLNRLLRQNESE